MNNIVITAVSFFLFLTACSSRNSKNNSSAGEIKKPPYLVVLSLDGYRWDYPDMYNTFCLDSIAGVGVKAHSLRPAFPSKTFPNHYTLATGLYPDNHGLVSNTFKSKKQNAFYRIRDREKVEDGSYYGGEPIWVSAEKQGVMSATYFWVGSEAKIKDTRPSIWKIYNHGIPFPDRADSVIAWLSRPVQKRPRLIMFYHHEPDGVGHRHNPKSEEVKSTVETLDRQLKVFCNKLQQLPIKDSINFIVLSDHGMGAVSSDKLVVLDNYIDSSMIDYIVGYNPSILIEPKNGHLDDVYNKLKNIEGISVWKKEDIPAHLHYGKNENISSLVVVADSAWSVTIDRPYVKGGTHGYCPTNKDMHAIFYASGPSFKKGYTHTSFQNIHVYELFCKLLDIVPAENDGEPGVTEPMLKR